MDIDKELLDNLIYVGIFTGIVLGTIIFAYFFNRIFRKILNKSSEAIQNDPTNYQFLRHALVGLVYVIGFSWAIYMMPNMRAIASSLLAGAGIIAVAVGFASQHALSNIISGVFIVIFKPFRVNDRLKINTLSGVVEDITLRHTVIRDFENRRILIPNSVISNEVIVNSDFEDEKIVKWLDVGISYDSDIDLARKIIQEEAMAHPLCLDNRTPDQIEQGAPQVVVRVISLGDFSVNLRAWIWAKDNADAWILGCDLLESVKKRFDREGVEIPFPYRTIVQKEMKKKEPLLTEAVAEYHPSDE